MEKSGGKFRKGGREVWKSPVGSLEKSGGKFGAEPVAPPGQKKIFEYFDCTPMILSNPPCGTKDKITLACIHEYYLRLTSSLRPPY